MEYQTGSEMLLAMLNELRKEKEREVVELQEEVNRVKKKLAELEDKPKLGYGIYNDMRNKTPEKDLNLSEEDIKAIVEAIDNPPKPNQSLVKAKEDYDGYMTDWKEIEEEYMKDNYPVFGGPFTDAEDIWTWLERYYEAPHRRKHL